MPQYLLRFESGYMWETKARGKEEAKKKAWTWTSSEVVEVWKKDEPQLPSRELLGDN